MKRNSSILLFVICVVSTGFFACEKKMTNQYFANGKTPILTITTTTLTPPTSDSLKKVLALSWTNPHYATDSASELYTIQIDSSGRNFSKAASMQVSGALSDSIMAKRLNDIALGFGFSFNVAYKMDVRVISSYANNNERLTSNVITITYTPYKVPPKVQPPSTDQLYIVGSATADGWNNPVPVPTQQFTRMDSVTYQGTFYLNGGDAYDFLPLNGSWAAKYNVASTAVQGLSQGGSFQYSTGPGSDIPGPAKSGIYQITVNFQTGIFSVSPVQLYSLLYVPGDYQGWSPSSAPTLASIKSDGMYEGYVNISTTGGFKFTDQPTWNGTNYGDTAANGESGILNAGGGNNLNIATAGYYFLQVNSTGLTWSATAITGWGLIGDFNGWSTDVPMTYNSGSQTWTGTISPGSAGGFKMRANGNWNLNYGTGGNAGSMSAGGGNIPITAGTHTITMSLSVPGYYTYTIQ